MKNCKQLFYIKLMKKHCVVSAIAFDHSTVMIIICVSYHRMDGKSLENSQEPMSITIIGSGDFGRALALRMIQCGYKVCIGSRNPEGSIR